jgi:hypothetical protein
VFESILCQVTEYDPDVLESLIELSVEIAREGREGRRAGTLFTLGDENAVLGMPIPSQEDYQMVGQQETWEWPCISSGLPVIRSQRSQPNISLGIYIPA